MKFSYITLLVLPCLAVASVLPRGGAGDYDHELCCAYVDYDGYDGYDYGDHHHHHYHHHDDGGVGHRCFRRYDDWCEFGEAVDCERYDPYDETASGCFSVDDDYGKAGKARKAGNAGKAGKAEKTAKTVKTVKAAKAA
ncbi:hypothetical protein APHAL10511_000709 [Amanita phalloides]|nr:hypothetical protein APHAL10511_000709 [Amanita phalloides]